MKHYRGRISDRTLSQNLKELEVNGLLVHQSYLQIPPKVVYSLSERGRLLMQVLDQLCVRGSENRPK